MRMVVQVVVVAEAVDVGPGLQPEIQRVVDAGVARVIDHGALEAGFQPGHGRVRMREEIGAEIVCGHVGGLHVHRLDEAGEDRVGLCRAGEAHAHQGGGPEGSELGFGHGAAPRRGR
jgi:hypothetical protein